MPGWFQILAALLSGYIIGSISFAVLISKSQGVNILEVGSGNPGATNVMRVFGKKMGYACFLLDAFKGIAAVFIGQGLAQTGPLSVQILGIIALVGAIAGHSYSVFLKFQGGKGVATTVGGVLTLMPVVMLIGAALWVIVFYASKYVSLSSLVLGISLPVSSYLLDRSEVEIYFSLFLALLIVIRHKSNIQRLLAGTENRAGGKKS